MGVVVAETRVGGLLEPSQCNRALQKDLGLIRQAVRKKWPITQENMDAALCRLMSVVEFCDDEAVAVSAVKTLSMLLKQNDEPSIPENRIVLEVTAENLEQRKQELRRRLTETPGSGTDAGAS